MAFAIPMIQPKSKLIDIAAKMLRTRMMVNPMQAPLQERPHADFR